MRGHGSVTVGESLPRASGRSGLSRAERAACSSRQIAIAGAGGRSVLDDSEIQGLRFPAQDYGRAWPMWRAKGAPPGIKS